MIMFSVLEPVYNTCFKYCHSLFSKSFSSLAATSFYIKHFAAFNKIFRFLEYLLQLLLEFKQNLIDINSTVVSEADINSISCIT